MPVVSNTFVQLGKESTWGTEVSATDIIPVTSDPTFTTEYNAVRDSGRRGIAAMDYQLLQGGGRSTVSLEGSAYPSTIGHYLMAILGTDTKTGASTPYVHTFTLAAATPSYTIEDVNPTQDRTYTGLKCSEVGFTFNAADGLLQATSSWTGKTPTTNTRTTGLTATLEKPWIGIDASVSLGGSVVARVTTFSLTMTRAADPIHATGSRDPIRIDEGPLEVTFSVALDAGATPTDDLTKYLGSSGAFTEHPIVLTCTYGASTTLRSIAFTMTNANYGEGAATRDMGSGLYQLTFSGRAMYNTTDSGPIKVVLNNAQSTAY